MLARQGLLERASRTLPAQLTAMAGLQAQYAPSMYIGLWSRVASFERDDLTTALQRRTVVQGTLLRSTIHLVAARDWWTHAVAGRDERRAWFIRSRRAAVTVPDMEAAADAIRTRMTAEGPLPRSEVEAEIGKPRTEGIHLWLDLVRVPPSGTWERRRADLFGLAEQWLRRPEPDADPAAARRQLVRSYLKAFGPASAAEISSWAGLPIRTIDAALEGQRLRRFRAEDGTLLVDVPGAPLPDPEAPAPVRFLPTWDAMLLIHVRRARILDEQHRPVVFSTKTPQSVPTFLVDGTVAGTWHHKGGRIETSPFEPLDRSNARAVRDEADALVRLFD